MPFLLSTTLIYTEQIHSDHLIHMQHMYIYIPNACQTDLEETPMNNLNNPLLLLFSHLVIAGKTQPSPENIRPNILKRD